MDFLSFLPDFLVSGPGRWIVQVFLIVFFSLIFDLVQKRVLNRLRLKLEKRKVLWEDALIGALQRPLRALIWLLGIAFAAEIVQEQTESAIFEIITPLRTVGVITIIAWFMHRLVGHVSEKVQSRRDVDKTTADAITKVLRASILITSGLVMLQSLGFSISGVLAFGGIGGIAIGFAAKDMLANFFGGLIIYWDQPFKVGDWIRSPDKEIEGTVEQIGWRLTCIRTFDKRPLYVPNAIFTTISVENPSRMTNRRIYEVIGVRYKDASQMRKVTDGIKEMLQNHPEIDTNQTLIVNMLKFGPSSLDIMIYTFTKTTVWVKFHEIKEDVLLKVYDVIAEQGCDVAFPTTTLDIPEQVQVETGLVPPTVSLKNAPIPQTNE